MPKYALGNNLCLYLVFNCEDEVEKFLENNEILHHGWACFGGYLNALCVQNTLEP